MLYHLCCPCLTYAPFKVRGFQYDTVIGPCLHVFRRVTEPFGDVEFLTAVGSVLAFVIFVVPYIQIERAIVYERSRVCRKLVFNKRITRVAEGRQLGLLCASCQ